MASSSPSSQAVSANAKKSKDTEDTVDMGVSGSEGQGEGFSSLGDHVFSNHILIGLIYSSLDFASRESLTRINWACKNNQHAKFLQQYESSRKPPPFRSFNDVKKFVSAYAGVKMVLDKEPHKIKFPRGGALTLEGVEKLVVQNPRQKSYYTARRSEVPWRFIQIVLRIFPNLREIVLEVPLGYWDCRRSWQTRNDREDMMRITGDLLDALATRPQCSLQRLRVEIGGRQIRKIRRLAVELERLALVDVTNEEGWSVKQWQSLRTSLIRHAGTLEVLKLPVVLDWNNAEIALDIPALPQLKVLELNFTRMKLTSGRKDRGLFPPLSFPQLQSEHQLSYCHLLPNLEELFIVVGDWIRGEKVERRWTKDILRAFFAGVGGAGHKKLRRCEVRTMGVPKKWEIEKGEEDKERRERNRRLRKRIKQTFPDLEDKNIILDGKACEKA